MYTLNSDVLMQHGRGSEQLSFTNSLETCRPTKNGRYNLLKNQDDVVYCDFTEPS